MSLINDALRRARQEAAEREAREKGLPPPVLPPPRRMGVHLPPAGVLMAVGLGALLVGVLVAVLAVLPGSGEGTAAIPEAASQGTSGTPEAGSDGRAVDEAARGVQPGARNPRRSSGSSSASMTTPPPAKRVQARPAERPPVLQPSSPSPAGARKPLVTPVPAQPTASARTTRPPRSTEPREYRGEARLGETTLTLDYIVYRSSDPFAEINGVELHEGWEVSGYTVVRIQADRVVLEGPAGEIVLLAR